MSFEFLVFFCFWFEHYITLFFFYLRIFSFLFRAVRFGHLSVLPGNRTSAVCRQVAVKSWFDDMADGELRDRLPLLESLARAEDVLGVLAQERRRQGLATASPPPS